MFRLLICLLSSLLISSGILAQNKLADTESRLKDLASIWLVNAPLKEKLSHNRQFAKLLIETLRQPESYEYPFDSLESISMLRAEDNSFRIFTWQILDKQDTSQYYGNQTHYYFGIVQRKYLNESGETEYIPIPLLEMNEIPPGVENLVLDDQNWLGGLYYPAKYHESIPTLSFKYYDPKLQDSKGKIKKVKQTFYVLLGWNGLDNRSNLKFVDVMSFDPEVKDRVIFGANVFYFDLVPKFRALFKYSEYAPFSLNYAYVKRGWRKKKMIVYDHLASPKPGERKLKEIWEMGPDGSYDALSYEKRGGYFGWFTNVELAEEYNSKINRKEIEEMREKEMARLKEAGIDLSKPK
ncbi:MAG: hypothetical protein AAF399_09300 [Bacteroidota bacterium]